jgi:hypothetical protein
VAGFSYPAGLALGRIVPPNLAAPTDLGLRQGPRARPPSYFADPVRCDRRDRFSKSAGGILWRRKELPELPQYKFTGALAGSRASQAGAMRQTRAKSAPRGVSPKKHRIYWLFAKPISPNQASAGAAKRGRCAGSSATGTTRLGPTVNFSLVGGTKARCADWGFSNSSASQLCI